MKGDSPRRPLSPSEGDEDAGNSGIGTVPEMAEPVPLGVSVVSSRRQCRTGSYVSPFTFLLPRRLTHQTSLKKQLRDALGERFTQTNNCSHHS